MKTDIKKLLSIVIPGALCLLLVIALAHFFAHNLALDKKIQAVEKEISYGTVLLRDKDAIERDYARYCSRSGNIAVSGDQALLSLLKTVEATAQKSGIALDAIKPLPVNPDPAGPRLFVEVECTSDIDRLVSYMYRLQSGPTPMSITKMQVNAQPNEYNTLKATLLITQIRVN